MLRERNLGKRGHAEARVPSGIKEDVPAGVISALRYFLSRVTKTWIGCRDNAWRCGAFKYIDHRSAFWKLGCT